jgi:hypothetical protein
LRSLRDLQVVIAIVLPDHDGQCVTSFVTSLKSKGWRINCSCLISGPRRYYRRSMPGAYWCAYILRVDC